MNKYECIFILVCVFFIGVCAAQIYNGYKDDCSTKVMINGIWTKDVKYVFNYTGTFICVNIDEVKELKELQNVCNHEIAHEIFARKCEKNITSCL